MMNDFLNGQLLNFSANSNSFLLLSSALDRKLLKNAACRLTVMIAFSYINVTSSPRRARLIFSAREKKNANASAMPNEIKTEP
jgi:hypothetical protein